jgi:hypothetical protein
VSVRRPRSPQGVISSGDSCLQPDPWHSSSPPRGVHYSLPSHWREGGLHKPLIEDQCGPLRPRPRGGIWGGGAVQCKGLALHALSHSPHDSSLLHSLEAGGHPVFRTLPMALPPPTWRGPPLRNTMSEFARARARHKVLPRLAGHVGMPDSGLVRPGHDPRHHRFYALWAPHGNGIVQRRSRGNTKFYSCPLLESTY